MDEEKVVTDTLVFTAPWVVPVESEIIQDGAVAVKSGTILEVDSTRRVLKKFPQARVIELGGILLPPLINCHIHLELSHITDIKRPDSETGMVTWIEQLLQKRSQDDITDQDIQGAVYDMVQEQYESGVILMADIGNARYDKDRINRGFPEIYPIYEVLAPNQQRTEDILKSLINLPDDIAVSPHAPYSSSADLICALKKRAVANQQTLSIHLAESVDETAFISSKTGPLRQFLEERGSWDGTILPEGIFSSGVDYLHSLNILDENTLCVHCVHIDDNDIEILFRSGARICLCPGSNEFLRVGTAPVAKMLSAGLLPALGTDSRASNEELNLWREMQILRKTFPELMPMKILTMATLGGAEALHREADYGSLKKGKRGVFLEIYLDDVNIVSEQEILDKLTSDGMPRKINWVSSDKYC